MDYKEEFEQLVSEKCYEEARILLEQNHIYALEDTFYYANLGWIYNQLERYDEAIVCLRKGLNLFSDDGWMYSQIAYAYNCQGNLEDGMKAIDKAFSLNFNEPWLYGEKGWCYKELQQYSDAIICFEDALMEDEDNVWLLSQAAFTYMELKDNESAEMYFLKCYRLLPNDDSLFDLVNFYKHVKKFQRVVDFLDYERASEFEAWRCFETGNAYHELHKEEDAIRFLKRSLMEGRDDTGIRTLMGDVYQALGMSEDRDEQYALALEYYEKALLREDAGDREWIWQEMIWIAHKQKDYVKKLALLDRGSMEFPENTWMQYHYARSYSDMDDYAHGVIACAKCIEMGEDTKEILDLYAWNLGRCEREQEAITQLLLRMDRFGEEEWCYGELGWDHALLKEYDEALEAYVKAASYDDNNFRHQSMISWCYLRKEDYARALAYMLKAKELGRNDGWLHSVLGEIYTGLGNKAEALAEYELAVSLGCDDQWIADEVKTLKKEVEIG